VGVFAVVWLIALPALAFYFLLWRPRQRQWARVRALQSSLHENDEVMTTSGIYGRIKSIRDDDLDLEIAPGTTIRVARGAIGERIEAEAEAD
jgi:preprotein translocase subunit YajC